MTETWYRVRSGMPMKIEPIAAERSSASNIWVDGRKRVKSTTFEAYFPTWALAHAHLLERAEREAFAARRGLDLANGFLGHVKYMKDPGTSSEGGAEHE